MVNNLVSECDEKRGPQIFSKHETGTNSDPRVSCTSALRSSLHSPLHPITITHRQSPSSFTLIKSINQDDDLHPSTCDHKCILQIKFIYHSTGSPSPTPLRPWAHPHLLKYSSVHGKENEAIHGRSTQTKG
jgi:hypothetical protein